MRALKFRAWSNEHNRYCDFVTLDESRRWIGWIMSSGVYLTTIDINLEQYTGLKDKNDKEIYEGDVVNIQGIKYYVDFEHGGFWFNNDNLKWKANRPFTHFQEINDTEVIGNVHENADLLEDK